MGEANDWEIAGLSDLRSVGAGGFAEVFKAKDAFGRPVAVKVLHAVDPSGVRRFDREREALGQVASHPNIVTPFTSGYTDNGSRPYVVMEYMDGGSIQERLEQDGPLTIAEAVSLVLQIAEALAFSHRAGVIHKDIKPANILLTEQGVPKLADFGISAIRDATQTSSVAYSLDFTPPETFHGASADGGDPRDERSDLYSLGASLYALIAGQGPFHSTTNSTPAGFMARIIGNDVPPTGNPSLDAFLAKAMAKNPVDRFATAEEFIAGLQTVDVSGLAGPTGHTSVVPPPNYSPGAPPQAPPGAGAPAFPGPTPGPSAPYGSPPTPTPTAGPPVQASPSVGSPYEPNSVTQSVQPAPWDPSRFPPPAGSSGGTGFAGVPPSPTDTVGGGGTSGSRRSSAVLLGAVGVVAVLLIGAVAAYVATRPADEDETAIATEDDGEEELAEDGAGEDSNDEDSTGDLGDDPDSGDDDTTEDGGTETESSPRTVPAGATSLAALPESTDGRALEVGLIQNGNEQTFVDLAPELFTAETGIEVNFTYVDQAELLDNANAGQYDVIYLGALDVQLQAAQGLLYDLDGFAAETPEYDVDDLYESVITDLSVDGRWYAAPVYTESSFLVYRADLLEEAGLTMPNNPTWDEVAAIAREIDSDDVAGICLRGRPGWGDLGASFSTMLNTFGGTWWAANSDGSIGDAQVDQPEFRETLTFYADLVEDAGTDYPALLSFDECRQEYINGNAAMWYDATFAAWPLEASDSAVRGLNGYAQAPVRQTEASGWLWSWTFAIPTNATDPRAAWEFLAWASGPEFTTVDSLANGGLVLTYRQSSFELPAAAEQLGAAAAATEEAIRSARPGAAGTTPRPGPPSVQHVSTPEFQEMATRCTELFASVLEDSLSIDAALTECQLVASGFSR